MRFLIAKEFFKNIPKEKIEYFYSEINKHKKTIFEAPKGFWVKKLRKNLYEFRVNSGDRILFEFREISRLGYGKKELVLLSYDKHDIVIKKGDRKDRKNLELEDFEIEKTGEIFENVEITEEEAEKIYKRINSKIMYEITSDSDLKELIKNEDEYSYFYLNDQQYEILNDEEFPLFLKGSAGSGKTTVAIRKAMELEEYQEYKVGYITFTRSLKEKAYGMYKKFRNSEDEKMVEFYSLEELYEKELNKKPVGFKMFNKFIYNYNPQPYPKGVENLELYQEIRGIIKGIMSKNGKGNWERNLNNAMIPKEDYLSLNKKYTIYDVKKRDEIYEFAKKYQNWLEERNYFDENDLAREVILKKESKFDYIICDEVQDLTEIEIYMLTKLVKIRGNVFLAGDIHQIINPTYFSFSRVKSLFYKDNYVEKALSKNYRSQKKIVDLANQLTKLRAEYIGKLGEDYKEVSILDEKDIFIDKIDYDFLKKLEENTTIVLVPTDETKEKLRKKIPEIENKILTVQDIKGLEFDSVVLYNFGSELKKYWKKIFNGEAKTNQLYRYYFNLLYVGITRARKRLLLMEEERKNNYLLEKLEDFLVPLAIEGKLAFTSKSGEADFLKEGKEFLSQGLYLEAISAFEKAGANKYLKKAKEQLEAERFFDENGEEETIKYIVEKDDSISKYLEKYVVNDKVGDYAFERKNYKKAKKYYIKSENHEKLSEIFELNGELKKSLEEAKKSGIEELVKRLEEKIEINNQAIKVAENIRSLPDNKKGLERYSLVEYNELDKKYITKTIKKNIGEICIILNGRFKEEVKDKKLYNIKSPTKLLIKLYYVEGSKNAVNYLLENFSNKLNIEALVSVLDSGNIIEKYISNTKKQINLNKLLLIASKNNKIKNVKKLIDLGGDINTKINDGKTPLYFAILNENLEMVKLLTEYEANLEELYEDKEEELTPLKLSIKIKNNEIFDFLIEHEIDLNHKFPIILAVEKNNYYAVKKLVEKGVKLDLIEEAKSKLIKEEERPLILAIFNQNYKIVKLLIDGGAKLKKGKAKYSPAIITIANKDIEGLRLLLKKGYKLTKKEIEIISRQSIGEMSNLVLEYELGSDYKEVLEKNMEDIISYRYKKSKINPKEKIVKKYDFEEYKTATLTKNKILKTLKEELKK